jgi:hypothetical protein
MFKTAITTNALVNDTANNFFQNIYGDPYNNDISFISTLRALVAPRMSSDDQLSVRFQRTSYSASEVGERTTTSTVRAICEYFYADDVGSIYIHSFENPAQDSNYACLELMKSTFCKTYQGWHRLEKVTEFYKKQFLTMCFINPDKKSVAIFVDSLDMRKMHYLQCSIFAFLPWYFDPEKGVSEIEMELINSLREKTSNKYEDVIARIASQYDFRSARIRQLLSGFETKFERIECNNIRGQLDRVRNNIDSLNRQIGDQLHTKNDLEIKLLGLETKISNASEDSEIMEYFLCNDRLVLLRVSNDTMLFGVKAYIEYFNEDMVESVLRNKSSYVYAPDGRSCNRHIPAESMEKLIRAIFIDQTLKIKVCAAYEFDLNGSVYAQQYFGFDHNFHDCMPNPHIDGYHCLGNYQRTINELLSKRDYITAIEQCVASAKSLNFGDSPVMNLFFRAIYKLDCNYNNKCIELPDGKVVDPKGAIAWLEEQESGENE